MQITQEVIKIVKRLSGEENVELTSQLQSELALDSLMMVTLLIEIEDGFDIQLDEADMNPYELETVESVVLLVKKYRGDSDEKKS